MSSRLKHQKVSTKAAMFSEKTLAMLEKANHDLLQSKALTEKARKETRSTVRKSLIVQHPPVATKDVPPPAEKTSEPAKNVPTQAATSVNKAPTSVKVRKSVEKKSDSTDIKSVSTNKKPDSSIEERKLVSKKKTSFAKKFVCNNQNLSESTSDVPSVRIDHIPEPKAKQKPKYSERQAEAKPEFTLKEAPKVTVASQNKTRIRRKAQLKPQKVETRGRKKSPVVKPVVKQE